MRYILCGICVMAVFLVMPCRPIWAQDNANGISATALRGLIETLNGRLDQIANSSTTKDQELGANFLRLERQLDDFRVLEEKLIALEKRQIEAEKLRKELSEAIETSGDLEKKITNISESTSKALTSAKEAQSRASSTGWILTIVSSIVSFLVIVIGLFFSARFVSLHSENQVTKALLERIEADLKETRSRNDQIEPAKS